MNNAPTISDAEWEVMNVLWNIPEPITANDVVKQLSTRHTWSPRTVKTMLNRLIRKGALHFEEQGNRYLYRPAVRREQCVRVASRSFLSRVFSGAAGPMLVHLVTHTELSAQEMQELQELLAEKQTGASRKGSKKDR